MYKNNVSYFENMKRKKTRKDMKKGKKKPAIQINYNLPNKLTYIGSLLR